jgi:hypothetical protein
MFKTLLLAVLTTFLLSSCTYYKVASVTSDKVKQINNSVVFENDSIKVTYNFWAKNGTMTFDIYNKLSIPIYFDWKKSAFIPNDKMMSYWQDETNTMGVSASSAYFLYGGGITASSKTKSKSIRQERVGVVPPRSLITSHKYSLVLPKTKWAAQSYTISDTPLRFRNYLAISPFEQFDKDVFYIDNDFFVSNVRKVKKTKIAAAKSADSFYITEQ